MLFCPTAWRSGSSPYYYCWADMQKLKEITAESHMSESAIEPGRLLAAVGASLVFKSPIEPLLRYCRYRKESSVFSADCARSTRNVELAS